MTPFNTITPETIRDEILQCVKEYNVLLDPLARFSDDHETFLKNQFLLAQGNYGSPDFEILLRVMKQIAARELKKGKDTSTISKNFLKIAKKIKNRCDIC